MHIFYDKTKALNEFGARGGVIKIFNQPDSLLMLIAYLPHAAYLTSFGTCLTPPHQLHLYYFYKISTTVLPELLLRDHAVIFSSPPLVAAISCFSFNLPRQKIPIHQNVKLCQTTQSKARQFNIFTQV